ncbi:hypothetical protein HMPREF9571_01924 [Cutibacterium acnes HL043PA2]|nr:hypothetical protein HMPREF9571_01924 [Cutibacterium acnes HL043PA2]
MDFPNADGVRGNGSRCRLPSWRIDLLLCSTFVLTVSTARTVNEKKVG